MRFVSIATLPLFLAIVIAAPLQGHDESPLEYVIGCLQVEKEGGIVKVSKGKFGWPVLLEKDPTAIVPWHGNTARVELEFPAGAASEFFASNGFKLDRGNEILAEIFADWPSHPMYSAWFELPRIGSVGAYAFRSSATAGKEAVTLFITQYTAHFVRPDIEPPEQDAGTGR